MLRRNCLFWTPSSYFFECLSLSRIQMWCSLLWLNEYLWRCFTTQLKLRKSSSRMHTMVWTAHKSLIYGTSLPWIMFWKLIFLLSMWQLGSHKLKQYIKRINLRKIKQLLLSTKWIIKIEKRKWSFEIRAKKQKSIIKKLKWLIIHLSRIK